MALSPGTRLGPYEITSHVGTGGMGEVYRATDTRLNRSVAVKILPPHFATDTHLRQRFEREARTLASLSHPHICPIHDVGSADGTDYLVMEFLDGETLSDRLDAGPLPLDLALTIGTAIADALDSAHRAGIVHRDLKPGNIMLTRSGAKLVDFGLAKDRDPRPGAGQSAVQTAPALTIEGSLLGTVPYMAPEQLEGRAADARTDIFALGAVLFEMVTGRRAFVGDSQASLISAILRDDPPPLAAALGATGGVGAAGSLKDLDYTVRRCLAKDPNDRWQSARDLMLHLRWVADSGSRPVDVAAVSPRRPVRAVVPWIVAALALAAALAAGWVASKRSPAVSPVVRFPIDVPPEAVFAPTTSIAAPHPAISPDGRQVAFLAQVGTEPVRVWVRALDSLEARALAGTDDAAFPFWSADSRFVGFFADGALKTIDVQGGAAHRVCDAPAGEGGTWNREGTIVFAPGAGGALYRVAASGGVASPVTTPSSSRVSVPHRWPFFLPDGRRFLFLDGDHIAVASLDSRDVRALTASDSQAAYSDAGYLLFVRGTALLALAFDATSAEVSGEPRQVADGISRSVSNAAFSVSSTGVLIYRSGRLVNRQLTWFDRAGTPLGSTGGVHDFSGVHLSPDERKVTYHRHDGRPDGDVWVVDLARGISERFTHAAENLSPVWSPDGTRVAYASNRDSGVNNLWVKAANGTGQDAPLLMSTVDKTPRSWSADGKLLAYESIGARGDIWILPLTGERTAFPFLETEFDEREPMFSPDQKWLAYRSNESGRDEVYVRAFPKGEGRWVISTAGGVTPQWRSDGRELFYQNNRDIWAVSIEPAATGLEVGEPRRLFDIGMGSAGWAVARDGQRILVGHGVEGRAPGVMTVTINWAATLRD